MFGFSFKRKLLLRVFGLIMTVSLFCTMGFSNSFAISDYDRAIIFSEYVIDKLNESNSNLNESLKIDSGEFATYPKKVFRYDDTEITDGSGKKQLIEDNIIEQEVYKDIQKTVEELVLGIDKKSDIEKASVIYEWIAKNIKYDYDSENMPKSATQSAFCAFKYRKAICDGFSQLLQMMMRLAGIPCKYVLSVSHKNSNTEKVSSHAFDIIYLNDGQRSGWTLLDSSWASCLLHQNENKQYSDNEILKKFFPAIDKSKSLKESNKSIISMKSHQIRYIGDNWAMDQAESFGDDKILMSSYIGDLRLVHIPGKLKRANGFCITISNELSKFNIPICFKFEKERFDTAREVIVEGDVEIDFNRCDKDILIAIKDTLNFDESNKYKFDETNNNRVLDKNSDNLVFDFSTVE